MFPSNFAKRALQIGPLAFAAGVTIKAVLTRVLGARLEILDDDVLRAVAKLRHPALDHLTIDVTALGSGTLVALATIVVSALLLASRDVLGTVHLALSAAGAGVLTDVFKIYFARPRPTVVPHLVAVTSYSHPSGHALGSAAVYFSFALIARRHLPRHLSREILIAFTLLMIFVIGFSRVYLGVHYASDVVAGALMGVGWSLTLAGLFSLLARQLEGRKSTVSTPAVD